MPTASGATALHSLCISSQTPSPTSSSSPSNSQQLNIHLSTKPKSLLQNHPLYPPTQANLSFQIREKILCLEIMGVDSGKALSLNPSLHSASLNSIEDIISFLQSKGILQKDLPRIFGMCPKVLTANIKTDLEPVFSFLSHDLKVPEHDYRKVINKCPRLLTSSARDQLKPALFYLQRLGFKDLNALAYQDSVLLVSNVENTLIPKLKYLESIGFSKDEAVLMVLRFPGLFTFSIENNLKPKFEYFNLEMKGKLEELKEFPQYFAFSLEKRIKPRHMQVLQKGARLSLPTMLKTSDDEFNELIKSKPVYRIAARTPRNSLPSCQWFVSHHRYGHQPTFRNSNENKKQLEPFSLGGDELSLISMRLRSMVVAEVPKLASAAGYFFKEGVKGKKLCPMVILLMASALNVCTPELSTNVLGNTLMLDLRRRQPCIAKITEMIHVS